MYQSKDKVKLDSGSFGILGKSSSAHRTTPSARDVDMTVDWLMDIFVNFLSSVLVSFTVELIGIDQK